MKDNLQENILFDKLLNNELAKDDIDDLNKKDSSLCKLINKASALEVPQLKSKEDIWDEISIKIKTRNSKKNIFKPNYKIVFSAAASIALLIGVYFTFSNSQTDVFAGKGKHISVFLPDSSEVILNAESEISYNKNTWKLNRKLSFTGEAFFKVKKGSKFTVKSPNGKIEVLGTSFNAFSRGKKFDVACFTGKVEVSQKHNSKIISKGQAVTKNEKEQFSVYEFDVNKKSQWRTGNFNFEASPLHIVFKELERQYNVNINLPDIDGRVYTGYFDNRNLDKALKAICLPMSLEYTIEGNNVVIAEIDRVK